MKAPQNNQPVEDENRETFHPAQTTQQVAIDEDDEDTTETVNRDGLDLLSSG